MTDEQLPRHDLEVFQRWATVVDDQLREAVNAVMALEDPDEEPLPGRGDIFSNRSSAELASDLIEEIAAFKEYPDRPAWFTPGFQMVLVVSTWAEFLLDYVNDFAPHGLMQLDAQRLRLIKEEIAPAIEHFDRFLTAVQAAGHLEN
jgi:hypothetical protein